MHMHDLFQFVINHLGLSVYVTLSPYVSQVLTVTRVRTTFGGLRQTPKLVLLCDPQNGMHPCYLYTYAFRFRYSDNKIAYLAPEGAPPVGDERLYLPYISR